MQSSCEPAAKGRHNPERHHWPEALLQRADASLPISCSDSGGIPGKMLATSGDALGVAPAVIAIWQVMPPNQPDPAQVIAQQLPDIGHEGEDFRLVEVFSVDAFAWAWVKTLTKRG